MKKYRLMPLLLAAAMLLSCGQGQARQPAPAALAKAPAAEALPPAKPGKKLDPNPYGEPMSTLGLRFISNDKLMFIAENDSGLSLGWYYAPSARPGGRLWNEQKQPDKALPQAFFSGDYIQLFDREDGLLRLVHPDLRGESYVNVPTGGVTMYGDAVSPDTTRFAAVSDDGGTLYVFSGNSELVWQSGGDGRFDGLRFFDVRFFDDARFFIVSAGPAGVKDRCIVIDAAGGEPLVIEGSERIQRIPGGFALVQGEAGTPNSQRQRPTDYLTVSIVDGAPVVKLCQTPEEYGSADLVILDEKLPYPVYSQYDGASGSRWFHIAAGGASALAGIPASDAGVVSDEFNGSAFGGAAFIPSPGGRWLAMLHGGEVWIYPFSSSDKQFDPFAGEDGSVIVRDYSEYEGLSPSSVMPAIWHENLDDVSEIAGYIVKGKFHDDARADIQYSPYRNNIAYACTISTFEISEVIRGELSAGDKIGVVEDYYVEQETKQIHNTYNTYPPCPGREYLLFLNSIPAGSERFAGLYSPVTVYDAGQMRFPVLDTSEPVDLDAFTCADLNLEPCDPSEYLRYFAEAIEKYMS